MVNKIKNLFEYQKFEQNKLLTALIDETQARYGTALSDDDLSIVAAAGNLYEMTDDNNQ